MTAAMFFVYSVTCW